MNDDDYLELLDEYLDRTADPNPEMANVRIVWARDRPEYGSLHIWEVHGLSEQQVEEVILETPPSVEAKRDPANPGRTYFWGATRADQWLFVVCEDWTEGDIRYLKPITAFEPEEGESYWRSQ